MPLSDKRIAANRANSLKSTGPTSIEGKRNTSRNATRHGILANHVLIQGESRERFAALINSFEAEFQPETPSERLCVEKMATSQWRLMRLWAVESAGITHEMRRQHDSMSDEDPPTRAMLAIRAIGDNGRHMDIMSRYEHRFDRQYYRAIEAFYRLRQARAIARAEQSHQAEENKGTQQ
jgi:hypothetical protein